VKILFVNAYSVNNRGDYAIVLAMKEYFHNLFPNCSIEVLSSYYDENREAYRREGLESQPAIWNILNKPLLIKYLDGIKALAKFYFKKNDPLFETYHRADLVCAVGGGYLYSSAKGPLGVGLLNMLFHIWLAKKFDKKVICFPQSVGPINFSLDARIVRHVLSKVDLFISRESMTTTMLTKKWYLNNVMEYPDIAFFLKPGQPYKIDISPDIYNIGVTVLDWSFADSHTTKAMMKEYIEKIVHSLDSSLRHYPAKVFIFIQVDVSHSDTDFEISKDMERLLKQRSINVEVVRFPQNADPRKIIATYGLMDLFIASRMHSAIFALDAKVPTIALAYQPKSEGTFKLLNLDRFVLPIKTFQSKALKKCITEIIEKREKYHFDTLENFKHHKTLDQYIKNILREN